MKFCFLRIFHSSSFPICSPWRAHFTTLRALFSPNLSHHKITIKTYCEIKYVNKLRFVPMIQHELCVWTCALKKTKFLPVQGYLKEGWLVPTKPRLDQRQASSILSRPEALGRSVTSHWSEQPGPCHRTSRRPTSLCGHG